MIDLEDTTGSPISDRMWLRICQSLDPNFAFRIGDRVRHEDYAGIGIVDEVLEDGISVNWCEWEDSWHYMSQDFPLLNSGLMLIERPYPSDMEDAA